MSSATLEAPAAPAAAPSAKPASLGSALPPSTGEIHVKAPSISEASAPKPGTARSRMLSDLRGKAKMTDGSTPVDPDAPAAPTAKAGERPGAAEASAPEEGQPPAATDPGSETPASAAPAEAKKGKVNPWKLVEEYKAQVAAKEVEIAEARKQTINPEIRKSELEKFSAIEKRAKELEDHIKFVEYSKSQEFQDTYEKPYEQAWARSMAELKDVAISDPNTGEERMMSPQDLLELVNLPMNKAMDRAREVFGESASIMMNYRAELRGLFQKKAQALEEAKVAGVAKMKADSELAQSRTAEAHKAAAATWEKANKFITDHPESGKYFKPVEGNDEINKSLERGYKFVDESMSQNPLDPRLDPKQREEVINRHAAIRHRAAAFGRVRAELEAERKLHAETKKKLEQYEKSEPETGGGTSPASAGTAGTTAKASVFGALRGLAR